MTVVQTHGRHAVTHYRVLEDHGPFSQLELTLETGRHHQIRVHLSHIGHPVAGDAVYGGDTASRHAQCTVGGGEIRPSTTQPSGVTRSHTWI